MQRSAGPDTIRAVTYTHWALPCHAVLCCAVCHRCVERRPSTTPSTSCPWTHPARCCWRRPGAHWPPSPTCTRRCAAQQWTLRHRCGQCAAAETAAAAAACCFALEVLEPTGLTRQCRADRVARLPHTSAHFLYAGVCVCVCVLTAASLAFAPVPTRRCPRCCSRW